MAHSGPEHKNGTGRKEGGIHPPFFFCLTSWGGDKLISRPWTGLSTTGSPGSQAFGLELNHTTGFPGVFSLPTADSEAFQPPKAHEPVPQNKSLWIYISCSRFCCFSGEPWLTQIRPA